MRSKVERHSEEAEQAVGDIRRATRRQYSAEEKGLMIAGLRGEDSVAELCREEGSTRISIIGSRRTSWRRARSDWPATPPAKRPVTK